MTRPFIVLVGLSGAGKTSVRRQLALRTGLRHWGPDDYRIGWPAVYDRLDLATGIVESVCCPDSLVERIRRRHALVVKLVAPSEVRYARMLESGVPPLKALRRRDEDPRITYGRPLEPHLIVDTVENDPDQSAALIEAAWKRHARLTPVP